MSLKRFLLVRIGRIAAIPIRLRLARFLRNCDRPEQVQAELLRRILAHQAETEYGTSHRFSTIDNAADYRSRVPIETYESLAPYIEKVANGNPHALLADPRVLMFALTSGTTASRKLIPVTRDYLRTYRRGWNMWGIRMYRDHRPRRIAMRPMLQLVGDPEEYRTPAGIPCGNLSGYTTRVQMGLIRRLYAVPTEVGKIKDPLARYYVALRFALGRDVSQFVAANPSTLSQLARTLDAEKDHLLRDLHDGTLRQDLDIPADIQQVLTARLRPRSADRARSRKLEAIAGQNGHLWPKDVWPPDGTIIATWTGGSMGPYLRQLPRYYGEPPVRDLGLLASEGRMTIPFENNTPAGVLDIASHYFEFVPEGEIDSPKPIVLGAHELEDGRHYYILPTTAYGLYRYHISDLVRVEGFVGRTPRLAFLGKGHRFANLTGEKLSEYQVTRAMDEVLKRVAQPVTGYSLAPVWDEAAPYYGVFIEEPDTQDEQRLQQFLMELDRELGEQNIEYAAKRQSGRLGRLRANVLPAGTWAAWDRQQLAKRGGAPEQYKHPCLIGEVEFKATVPVLRELG